MAGASLSREDTEASGSELSHEGRVLLGIRRMQKRSENMASRAMKLSPKKGRAIEPVTVDGNAVALLAYQLWQKRGSPIGSAEDDWFQAENELQARTGQAQKT